MVEYRLNNERNEDESKTKLLGMIHIEFNQFKQKVNKLQHNFDEFTKINAAIKLNTENCFSCGRTTNNLFGTLPANTPISSPPNTGNGFRTPQPKRLHSNISRTSSVVKLPDVKNSIG